MRKTTVYLPDDLDRALKAKARRTGVPAAELVRQALRESFEADEKPWPESIGVGAGGSFPAAGDEATLAREWARRRG